MSDFKERNEHFARAMTDAQVSYIEAERAACDLEAENARLRELVRDVWHLLYDQLFKAHEVPYDELKAVSDRMRELGVEVD